MLGSNARGQLTDPASAARFQLQAATRQRQGYGGSSPGGMFGGGYGAPSQQSIFSSGYGYNAGMGGDAFGQPNTKLTTVANWNRPKAMTGAAPVQPTPYNPATIANRPMPAAATPAPQQSVEAPAAFMNMFMKLSPAEQAAWRQQYPQYFKPDTMSSTAGLASPTVAPGPTSGVPMPWGQPQQQAPVPAATTQAIPTYGNPFQGLR